MVQAANGQSSEATTLHAAVADTSVATAPDAIAANSGGATALGLWWLSFFGSLALSAAAVYLLPRPLVAAAENTYVITLELFARALWLFAGLMVLWLMFRVSLRAAKIGG